IMLTIRSAVADASDSIWRILKRIIRAGETYTLPRDLNREDALAYWRSGRHEAFVADDDGDVIGTYYLRANQNVGGSHVANCGYMTAVGSGRGAARSMCAPSLIHAKGRGFRAMQF